MSSPSDETHVYTDHETDFSVYKFYDFIGGSYYKLYDSDNDYVRKYESKAEAIEAAKNGDG